MEIKDIFRQISI